MGHLIARKRYLRELIEASCKRFKTAAFNHSVESTCQFDQPLEELSSHKFCHGAIETARNEGEAVGMAMRRKPTQ